MPLKHALICFALATTLHLCRGQNETEVAGNERPGRVFSLFSIVAFKNTGCRSSSSLTTGQSSARNGTCYTSSECTSKGGTASGNCAAGFGVCCLFLVSTTGTTITQNCTYLRNPDFPNALTTATQLSYTIQKCSAEVCYLRLDFEQFNTLPPSIQDFALTSAQTASLCDQDTMVVTATNSGQKIPTICGLNTGQHIYVNLGNAPTDSATIAFTFTGVTTTRMWEIKVSQIECTNTNRPPEGCLQYWTTVTGRITTFNFLQTAVGNQQHLGNQDVSVCIRRQAGYCCVQYTVCPDLTDSFSLDATAAINAGILSSEVDSQCTNDYVNIPSASASCGGTILHSKFCSSMLDPFNSNLALNVPVCSCETPFRVDFHTDGVGDLSIIAGFDVGFVIQASRGICLDYTQIPCA